MRHVTDDERRARLAVRHALAPALRAASSEAATRVMTVLHATEPATVYLSLWARVGSLDRAAVDQALQHDRTLVKQLAMRRTLFVFPSWAALLPVLDPTVMGWRGRDFYVGPHRDQIFERRGNAGATAWVDGRVVGCWVQDDAGVVQVRLLEQVSARARRALDAEAARLTSWLGGFRVPAAYLSPAMAAGGGQVTGSSTVIRESAPRP